MSTARQRIKGERLSGLALGRRVPCASWHERRDGTGPRLRVLLTLAAVLAFGVGGCRSAVDRDEPFVEPPPKPRVLVRNFDTSKAKAQGVDASIAYLGHQVPESIRQNLEWWEFEAVMARDPSPGPGVLIVEGRIVSVNGGSRAARWAAGPFAGSVELAVEVRVVGDDGLVLAAFESAHSNSGGFFGGSTEGHLETLVSWIGAEVAETIAEGSYPFSYEAGKPWNSAAYEPRESNADFEPSGRTVAPSRTIEARLKELDALYREGLIKDQERKAQRAKILNEL